MSLMSMAVVELSLRLPAGRMCPAPDVRFWVDLEPGAGLGAETEVALSLERPWVFRGSFVVDRPGRDTIFYRLGLCAAPRSVWTLRIRDGAKGVDLLSDGDTLDAPKSWLVGTFPIADTRAGRGQVVSLDDARSRRASRAGHGHAPR